MNEQSSFWQNLFFPFLVVITFVAIYFIYRANPLLMAQESFLDQIKKEVADNSRLVSMPGAESSISIKPVFFEALNPQGSRSLGSERLIAHSFTPLKTLEVFSSANLGEERYAISEELIFVNAIRSLSAFDHHGKLEWKLELNDNELSCRGVPAVSESHIFTCTESGQVIAINKHKGEVDWFHNTNERLFRAPQLHNGELFVFVDAKPGQSWDLLRLSPQTGQIVKRLGPYEHTLSGPLTSSKENPNHLYFTTESAHLFSVNLESGRTVWRADSSAPYRNPPVATADRVYSANEAGVIYAHEARNGRLAWEFNIDGKIASPITFSPELGQLYVIDHIGYLHVMDVRTGRRLWRMNTSNVSGTKEAFAIRMRQESFSALRFSSQVQNWTIWAFCSGQRICIYDPRSSVLLYRIELGGLLAGSLVLSHSGEELFAPISVDKQKPFVLQHLVTPAYLERQERPEEELEPTE